MTEEVQEGVRDDVQDFEIDGEETTEEVADQPETQEEPEETPEERKQRIEFSEEQQKYINEHIVARQVAKRKEIERELEELRQRAQQTRPDDDGRPHIPDPPNIWDDDYEEKIKARDEAIREAAAWETSQREREAWEQQQAQLRAQQEQQALVEKVGTYTSRAKDYGIDEKDLQVAGNAVSQYGIPEQLIEYILEDDAGPAITVHLSRNLQELAELNQMNPIRAAAYIAEKVKPRAMKNAKRRSAPPEPTENPKGGGVPEKERGPKGAVYE